MHHATLKSIYENPTPVITFALKSGRLLFWDQEGSGGRQGTSSPLPCSRAEVLAGAGEAPSEKCRSDAVSVCR